MSCQTVGGLSPLPMPQDVPKPVAVGWECPRCKAINSPWVTQCNCKGTLGAQEK
jgi:hypothetical protein